MNGTFTVRLYDEEGCVYLSLIHDDEEGAKDGRCFDCTFGSWNVFGFAR
jgi:hypothetical protein